MGGIGLILSKTKVPVQPLRISGAFEAFPIGATFPRIRPVTVTVGDPIPFTPAELNAKGKEAYQHLTDKMMDAIRALPTEEPLPRLPPAMLSRLKLIDFRCDRLFLADTPAGSRHSGETMPREKPPCRRRSASCRCNPRARHAPAP